MQLSHAYFDLVAMHTIFFAMQQRQYDEGTKEDFIIGRLSETHKEDAAILEVDDGV